MKTRRNIKGLTLQELREFVESIGEKPYRARQLFRWMYGRGAQSFDEMTDLSKPLRMTLEQAARVGNLESSTQRKSMRDGTTKFLFRLSDGLQIESVLIPPDKTSPGAEKRLTLCVSTQVGCPLDCVFCATGTMGFQRNLTPGEIVDQVLQAQRYSPRRITNLVYMGMGEPMLNYENVMKSVEIISDVHGLTIGPKRITISTAGYADKIRRLADERQSIKLAVSLHSLDEEKRSLLMPINKKFPIRSLIESLEYYYRAVRRRPTLEYIVFDGFNNTADDVTRLADLSRRFPFKVNLIPFHPIGFANPTGIGAGLRGASSAAIEDFAGALRARNMTVMVRSSSGEDIEAACGQLAVQESSARAGRNRRAPAGSFQAHIPATFTHSSKL